MGVDSGTRGRVVVLDDFLDAARLDYHLARGNVSVRPHPDDSGLVIYNYTKQCQYAGTWDDVTRKTRGLIVHDGVVVARGPEKFFNYGEGKLLIAADGEFVSYDKIDGCLGIAYRNPKGGISIATRGSFGSPMAEEANRIFREKYLSSEVDLLGDLDFGLTPCFEIVYPENRIVVDYGDTRDLFFLGWTTPHSRTLSVLPDGINSAFPLPEKFVFNSLQSLLDFHRGGKEGLVVHHAGQMFKIKQADYVELHKIATGLSSLAIWERWRNGEAKDEFIASLPDELQLWAENVWDDLEDWSREGLADALNAYDRLPKGLSRKEFSEAVRASGANPGYMFLLLDGRADRVLEKIRDELRPKGNKLQGDNDD